MAHAQQPIAPISRNPKGSPRTTAPVIIASIGTMTVEMPDKAVGRELTMENQATLPSAMGTMVAAYVVATFQVIR